MKAAWIGLGGNVGDVRASMVAALDRLGEGGCRVQAVSSLYETPPWGPVEQARFLNACVTVKTDLAPITLLALLHAIETELSRVRRERWGPRTIDLDLLAYESFVSGSDELTVPHPRIAERAFVLVPLAEIAPDLVIDGSPVAARAAAIDRGDMRMLARDWYGSATAS